MGKIQRDQCVSDLFDKTTYFGSLLASLGRLGTRIRHTLSAQVITCTEKCGKITFLSVVGPPGAPFGRHLPSCGRQRGGLDRTLANYEGTWGDFCTTFSKKAHFVILAPRWSETTTFGGLAVQVGATWSLKSHPGDARGSQNGGQDKHGSKSCRLFRVGGEVVCQSYGNNCKSAGNQVKPEVKVYITDKSYD
jgi:hypothetical protein